MDATALAALSAKVKAITRPVPALLLYYFLTALLTLAASPLVFVPLYFRYHTLWYRFGDTGISMGYGILFRRELQLTYARMQDIHLSQDLLERWLGIGTVTVQTAGAGGSGNLSIVGIRDFEAVRDYLYARMRGVRDEPRLQGTEVLLAEIRDALRATARALTSLPGPSSARPPA